MAKAKTIAIPVALHAEYVKNAELVKDLHKSIAEGEAKEVALRKERDAEEQRTVHPAKFLKDEDIHAIRERLDQIVFSLLAMNRIAQEGRDSIDSKSEMLCIALQEMARANVKGLDACVKRLTGRESYGNWADELGEAS